MILSTCLEIVRLVIKKKKSSRIMQCNETKKMFVLWNNLLGKLLIFLSKCVKGVVCDLKSMIWIWPKLSTGIQENT